MLPFGSGFFIVFEKANKLLRLSAKLAFINGFCKVLVELCPFEFLHHVQLWIANKNITIWKCLDHEIVGWSAFGKWDNVFWFSHRASSFSFLQNRHHLGLHYAQQTILCGAVTMPVCMCQRCHRWGEQGRPRIYQLNL